MSSNIEKNLKAFLDYDKDSENLKNIKTDKKYLDNDYTLSNLEKNAQILRNKYPKGGIKSSRFITSKILMKAPKNYFSKYLDDVEKAVGWVQTEISDRGLSETIANAIENPLDEKIQDETYRLIRARANNVLDKLPYRGFERNLMVTLICNELIGFGPIDPLWRDNSIDEIICNGPFDIQVEIHGKWYRVPSCKFRNASHLKNLINKIFSENNKQLSRSTPLVKARLYDNSRIMATDNSVSPKGPNVAIRRHREKYWEPEELVKNGTASEELMTYIGNLINKGMSYLIVGGMGTGKTTLFNALTGFYPDNERLITLEDNIEMKPNPNKMLAAAMECVPPRPDTPSDKGVTMRDLVQTSTQLHPDGILIGEVTDSAAYDLCQALNLGRYGASTIHANGDNDCIYRLEGLVSQSGLIFGNSTLPFIASAFDFFICVEHFPIDGSRKIVSVSEVKPYPEIGKDGQPTLRTNPIWKYVQKGIVNGKVTGEWVKVGKMSDIRSERRHLKLGKALTWEELKKLSTVKKTNDINTK